MRRVLQEGDGRRQQHAGAHLQELEASAVGYRFGVQDVFVLAELLGHERVGAVFFLSGPDPVSSQVSSWTSAHGAPRVTLSRLVSHVRVVGAVVSPRPSPHGSGVFLAKGRAASMASMASAAREKEPTKGRGQAQKEKCGMRNPRETKGWPGEGAGVGRA